MGDPLTILHAGLRGRYTIGTELGRGGMSIVYQATDPRLHRQVAIKVMRPGAAAALGLDRFDQEITTTAGLAHPHIVPVLDSGVVGEGPEAQPYFVMPLIEGESLRHLLKRSGQLPLERALAIVRDVGAALQFAHSHGVIHRDVKPENVLLAGDQALLTDFGIAKPTQEGERARLTSTGFVLGTPGYMSPEQHAGDAGVDGRSDLYALAVLLYESLTGQQPFEGGPPQAALARQLAGEVRSVHTVRPGVPKVLDGVLHRALAPNPADRFASIADFLEALTQAERSGVVPDRTAIRRRVAIGSTAILLVAAGAIWWGTRPSAPPLDSRLGVAIMPFRASAEVERLGEALPDLVATLLTGTTRLRVADPWALWRPLRTNPQDRARSPDPEEAGRIAARSRADRIVLGRIDQEAAAVNLTVKIYGAGFLDPVAQFTVSAPVDSTATLARRAAVEVLANVWKGTERPPAMELADAPLTQSPEALKAYLEAREAARRGQPDSADAAITRSLAADSTFGLALIEAVAIRSMVQFLRGQPYAGLRELVERALAASDSLPERHRLRLVATQASIETDGPAAAAAWQRLIELDSTNVEAWNGLAYTNLVYGWQYGATTAENQRVAARAVELDSTSVPARFRLAQLLPELHDESVLRRESEALRQIEATSPMLRGSRLGLDALLAVDSAYAAEIDSLVTLPPVQWGSVFRRLRAYRPDRALALTRRTLEREGSDFKHSLAVAGQVGLLAAIGRWSELDSMVASGALARVPGLDVVVRQKKLAAAMIGGADSTAAAAAAVLARALPIDSAVARYQQWDVWRTGWLVAAYHAAIGDATIAAAWRGQFLLIPASGNPPRWAAANAADIGSRLAARRGQSDSAASLAQEAYALWTVHTENVPDHEPEPGFRFRLARTLRAAGRNDSAAVMFRSLLPPTTWIGVYTVRSLIELGEIAAARGDRTAAARYFDWALQYLELAEDGRAAWRDAALAGRAAAGPPPRRFGAGLPR